MVERPAEQRCWVLSRTDNRTRRAACKRCRVILQQCLSENPVNFTVYSEAHTEQTGLIYYLLSEMVSARIGGQL